MWDSTIQLLMAQSGVYLELPGATFLGYPVPLWGAKKKVGILTAVNGLMTIPPKWLSNLSAHIKTVLWD
jgi:hypothetical protein